MRRLLLAVPMLLALTATTGSAFAQDAADTMSVKSTAVTGGSASKPKAVAPTWSIDVVAARPGERATTPIEHDFSWGGVRENGKYFKTCTADQMDIAQSDSVCNAKALVAKGSLVANLGPEGVRGQNVTCMKSFNIYNAGAGKAALFPYGDASKCAGVGYLPPLKLKWVTKGNTSTLRTVFPDNITHPLPGIEGSFSHVDYKFVQRMTTIRKGGKKQKIGYLSSTGCGTAKSRAFTFTSKTPGHPSGAIASAAAGRC